ncbi:MAG: glutathione-disulfide reductase [Deltaproteobacteria bacterium]|nr:glutathione-disulfide reductase [Deltaproteobacteria bacterium]
MSEYDFDLFTLGAGSGGVAASRRAGSYGARVAICEDSRVGGTCVIRGCVPKKLLVYGAQFAESFSDAMGFGWSAATPSFDWGALVAAKDREVDRLNAIYLRLLRDSGVTLIEGRGRVLDAHTVEVDGRRYTAANILVATGSSPILPPVKGIEHAITSNEALSLPSLPQRVVIVGGGYIAVEFAGIFNALGARVTLLIRGESILRGFDQDLCTFLTGELRKKGVEIRCETFVQDIERHADMLNVMTRAGEEISADVVLYATGRAPNTKGLGLEACGVSLSDNGAVVVDDFSRTAVPSIYAVGDCTDRVNLTPVAIREGRAVAESIFNNNPTRVDHRNIASAVFSQPPAATVGLTEAEARVQHGAIDVYVTNFRGMKHSLTGRDERTLMKLVVARSDDKVLGIHMVGADAPEIIQGLAVAIQCGATKAQLDATVAIHPTAAEEFVTLRDRRPDPEPHP